MNAVPPFTEANQNAAGHQTRGAASGGETNEAGILL